MKITELVALRDYLIEGIEGNGDNEPTIERCFIAEKTRLINYVYNMGVLTSIIDVSHRRSFDGIIFASEKYTKLLGKDGIDDHSVNNWRDIPVNLAFGAVLLGVATAMLKKIRFGEKISNYKIIINSDTGAVIQVAGIRTGYIRLIKATDEDACIVVTSMTIMNKKRMPKSDKDIFTYESTTKDIGTAVKLCVNNLFSINWSKVSSDIKVVFGESFLSANSNLSLGTFDLYSLVKKYKDEIVGGTDTYFIYNFVRMISEMLYTFRHSKENDWETENRMSIDEAIKAIDSYFYGFDVANYLSKSDQAGQNLLLKTSRREIHTVIVAQGGVTHYLSSKCTSPPNVNDLPDYIHDRVKILKTLDEAHFVPDVGFWREVSNSGTSANGIVSVANCKLYFVLPPGFSNARTDETNNRTA